MLLEEHGLHCSSVTVHAADDADCSNDFSVEHMSAADSCGVS